MTENLRDVFVDQAVAEFEEAYEAEGGVADWDHAAMHAAMSALLDWLDSRRFSE